MSELLTQILAALGATLGVINAGGSLYNYLYRDRARIEATACYDGDDGSPDELGIYVTVKTSADERRYCAGVPLVNEAKNGEGKCFPSRWC